MSEPAATRTLPPPARVGMHLSEVDTPALLLDLDGFERNLDRLDATLAGRNMRLRPHAKSHKTPQLALRQIARGAVGVCCQKVSEAEAMVAGGVQNVLVANEVVGRAKLARLAALAKRATIGVCVDDLGNLGELEAAAREAGSRPDVYVEIDVGANRCGVAPGEPALAMARAIASARNVRFAGIHAYHGGAQHLRTPQERSAAIAQAVEKVKTSKAMMEAAGIKVEIVTGAGTGTYTLEATSGVYNELQPGSYVFMDADYGRNLDAEGKQVLEFDYALTILATVMSRPTAQRAVVDVGLKAHSVDSGMPTVVGIEGARYLKASDEHGVLDVPHVASVRLGDKIRLIPGHCDPTVNLYDWLVCIRGERVEDIWPIAARGAFY